MTQISTVQLLDFEATAEGDLIEWLEVAGCSIAVSHTNKVLTIGRDAKGGLQVNHVLFDRVTGVCLTAGGDVLVAAGHELWRLTDALTPGDLSPTGADRWLMCRVARFVGGVRLADPVAVGDDCWFASVALSAVCSLDDTMSARVQWKPSFISSVRPEQRCRLTGLGARDGVPTVVTSASRADTPAGWSAHQRNGGLVIDITTDEVLAEGLSLPHSPRWHDGKWWMLQAGTGELGFIDRGRFEAVARIDGFARGMAIHHGVAIAIRVRASAIFSHARFVDAAVRGVEHTVAVIVWIWATVVVFETIDVFFGVWAAVGGVTDTVGVVVGFRTAVIVLEAVTIFRLIRATVVGVDNTVGVVIEVWATIIVLIAVAIFRFFVATIRTVRNAIAVAIAAADFAYACWLR